MLNKSQFNVFLSTSGLFKTFLIVFGKKLLSAADIKIFFLFFPLLQFCLSVCKFINEN